jgi:hypothetical protein
MEGGKMTGYKSMAEAVGEIVAEKQAKEQASAKAAGVVRVGNLADYRAGTLHGDLFLYVEAGGRGMLRINYVTPDLWVHTEGNAGFGQSWCCHGGVPVYARVRA